MGRLILLIIEHKDDLSVISARETDMNDGSVWL
jgi:hypothetical protein